MGRGRVASHHLPRFVDGIEHLPLASAVQVTCAADRNRPGSAFARCPLARSRAGLFRRRGGGVTGGPGCGGASFGAWNAIGLILGFAASLPASASCPLGLAARRPLWLPDCSDRSPGAGAALGVLRVLAGQGLRSQPAQVAAGDIHPRLGILESQTADDRQAAPLSLRAVSTKRARYELSSLGLAGATLQVSERGFPPTSVSPLHQGRLCQ